MIEDKRLNCDIMHSGSVDSLQCPEWGSNPVFQRPAVRK
jgi:hypothetical protein